MPQTYKSIAEAKKDITPDVVYQEMYEEMRRFRDYELNSSTWYTAILLALAGAIFASRFTPQSQVGSIIDTPIIKALLTLASVLLSACGIFSACFAASRYDHVREWMNNNFEPSWKKYRPQHRCLKPIHVIVLTQLAITVVALLGIWI